MKPSYRANSNRALPHQKKASPHSSAVSPYFLALKFKNINVNVGISTGKHTISNTQTLFAMVQKYTCTQFGIISVMTFQPTNHDKAALFSSEMAAKGKKKMKQVFIEFLNFNMGCMCLTLVMSLVSSQHAAGLLQGAHCLHHLPHHQVLLARSNQLVGFLHVCYTTRKGKYS